MTNVKIQESLGRLSCLKWFPTNTYALVAIAEILRDLCPSDNDATVLVQKMLGGFDEWPGPESLRKTHALILDERRAAQRESKLREAYAVSAAARKDHEATCPGYVVELDKESHVVGVSVCRERFGGRDVELWHQLPCRKGEAFNPLLIRPLLEAELSARPGWISLEAHYVKQFSEIQRRRNGAQRQGQ